MKKTILIILLTIFFSINIDAKSTCQTNNLEKVCIEKVSKYIFEKRYTYQDSEFKKLLKYEYKKSDKKNKLLYRSVKNYYLNTKLKLFQKYYYHSNFKYVKKSYNSKGKIVANYQKINYEKKYSENNYQYDSKGKYLTREYMEKDYNQKILKTIKSEYYPNKNKVVKKVEKRYKNNKVYLTITRKYTSAGKLKYYFSTNSTDNKITTKNTYNKNGVKLKSVVMKYDKNKKLVNKQTTNFYLNGKKKKISNIDYVKNSSLIKHKVIEYRKNNKNNNLTAKNFYYYNKGKRIKRLIKYYHVTTFKYIGTRTTTYNKGIILEDVKITYYTDLKREYAKTIYKYNDKNIKTKQITYYYEYSGKKIKKVEKRYNTKNKVTYDLTLFYNNGLPSLKTGYTYQSKTYTYNYHLYFKGVERMVDKTSYLNKTITKTKYQRLHYNKDKKLIKTDNYDYKNGEIATNKKKILKPVKSAIVSSPAWFYPVSFGGGWHPGIDVATYRIKKSDNKTYTRSQPIKLNFKQATVLSRYNKCHSTNSWGCGNNAYGGGGLGNYVLIATEIDGRFYTILYAHQTKLIEKNTTYKTLISKDKKANSYKTNQIIGYVGSSGNSTGHHIHIQVQEHFYAKSIEDVKLRFNKENKNILFNVPYSRLGNGYDIFVTNPDLLFNLKYNKSW